MDGKILSPEAARVSVARDAHRRWPRQLADRDRNPANRHHDVVNYF